MITEAQIRDRLFGYLTREITLNEFEDWLVQHSWNMHQDSDEVAQHLVGAIEVRLAEYSNEHLDDDSLERELRGLLARPLVVSIDNGAPVEPQWTGGTVSASSVVTVRGALAA
jgi:hypothetical protein